MGDSVGAAVFIGAAALSLLAGDGSLSITNVVLLPAEIDGKTLDSKEVSKSVAQQLIVARYSAAAERFGYSFVCEHSCDAFPSLFRMKQRQDTVPSPFIYAHLMLR
ncbi:hypothetical protein [Arsukibacterium sp. MJ3]|uniref:hypothetical protein n=1 Tax=Arsukibacterium sp. MJ3 TaxID=1632859 RepID=UPI00128B2B95|nr:hypothetical protein [Arsukibacterium sp. MJ3]